MNNKGFSLVELIVVIAIMAVLMGVLAPTLIGNIEKSRESKDLQNLDTVYNAVNEALSSEAVAKERAAGMTATKLSVLLGASDSSKLGDKLAETLGSAPELTATCNASSEIWIIIDGNLKARVYADDDGTDTTGNACKKTEDSSGNARHMVVGTANNPSGS